MGVVSIYGNLQQPRAPEESQGLTGLDIRVRFLEPIDAPAFSFDLPRPTSDPECIFSPGYIRNQITEGVSEENLAQQKNVLLFLKQLACAECRLRGQQSRYGPFQPDNRDTYF
jgi:hypothetical protein